MIFPHVPKPWAAQWPTQPEPASVDSIEQAVVETPLRGLDIEQWFAAHGLPHNATDPAAGSCRNTEEPIDWFAKDAWEFYLLCIGMLIWIVYWYGVHRGVW